MSDPKDLRPRDAWDAVEDSLLDEELASLGELTPEQLREQLAAQGLDPDGGRRAAEEAIAAAMATGPGGRGEGSAEPPPETHAPTPTGKVVSLAEARGRRSIRPAVWMLSAAAAAALVVGGIERRPIGAQLDAWLHPAPSGGPTQRPDGPPLPHEPSPLERAAALRQEATADVAKGYMGEALDALDEADALDPDGGASLPIKDLREKASAPRVQRPLEAKPGVAPWERPLKKRVVP